MRYRDIAWYIEMKKIQRKKRRLFMNKKKTTAVVALSALVVVGVIGGTYAYWNQTATIENPFDTGSYGTSLIEDFTPEENWQPGVEIDKEVYVENTGDQDVIVRVKLDESWTYDGQTEAYKENAAEAADQTDDIGDVYTVYQDNATDGLTAADQSVVTKYFSDSTYWTDGEDGWYYYTVNLASGAYTDSWLTSVELLDDADMGAYETKTYVTTDAELDEDTVWYEYDLEEGMPMYVGTDGAFYYSEAEAEDDGNAAFVQHSKSENALALDSEGDEVGLGYSSSDYVLTITVETVQATTDAVETVFGTGTTEESYAENWVLAD